jgi:hypothetical protein
MKNARPNYAESATHSPSSCTTESRAIHKHASAIHDTKSADLILPGCSGFCLGSRGTGLHWNSCGEIPANREPSSPPQTETPVHPEQHATLAEVNGPGTYLLLAIPITVAGMPLLFRSRAVRILSAVLILGWIVIGVASIGLFYIPSAVMMVWSALGKSA